ncbi:hypothetical protein BDU57DRAFT_256212 [Ampelomyces quisqualis]|uniref:Uncharacterized protein n=1 Tax=Ampelomyces quisqualis TaxID=50730 RepID=A0A6A5QP09_AMPQU|nr:hypothetical protein BDU57DRAFT_256212 [Ampelomyces quisqualis]
MRTTMLIALSAGVSAYAPAHPSHTTTQTLPNSTPSTIAGYSNPSPSADEPCESKKSTSEMASGRHQTATVIVAISSPVPSRPPSFKESLSTGNSFYVSPPSIPSSSKPVLLPTSSAIIPAPTFSVPAIHTSSATAAVPTSSYPVVPLPVPSPSPKDSLSPSNSFYVVLPPASSVLQATYSTASPLTFSTLASPSNTPIIPAPVYTSSLGSAASVPSAVALIQVQSQLYIPGVIPSSTPGVVPLFTPGVLLPSLTPGIVPPVQTSVATFVQSSQATTSTVVSSVSSSATSRPFTLDISISSAIPPASSTLSSITSAAPSVQSSITSAASSAAKSYAPTSQTSTSAPESTASSPRPSSPAASTIRTSSSRTSSATTQTTSIPPAPSAGGSSSTFGTGSKERVWWVAFFIPLVVLV